MDTPEFLVWAIEFACPIRGFQDGRDPERTERQLRAARAVSDARHQGRAFEDLCVDPPNGFRIADALRIYGGVSAVEHACSMCPANAAARLTGGSIAGCFGVLPLLPDERLIHASIESAIDRGGLALEYEQLFVPTQSRWYGLWIHSPLGPTQLSFLVALLGGLDVAEPARAAFREFQAGLLTAINAKLPLHTALYPRGHVEATCWRLVPHCPRCKAAWAGPQSRQCGICGFLGHPAPDKRRKARGQRPYRPLDQLLGKQAAAEFLVRYAAFQEPPKSPDQAQTPPREVPRDSLPPG